MAALFLVPVPFFDSKRNRYSNIYPVLVIVAHFKVSKHLPREGKNTGAAART